MSDPSSLSQTINDPKRLGLLHATDLLDSPPEEAFDRFTRLAIKILHAPIALVSLVDKDRQFFKSHAGLTGTIATTRQTPLSHSFCKHVLATAEPLIVFDARQHPLLRNNPAVKDFQVIAYLGVPLQAPDGQVLGTLCTVDTKPHPWSEEEVKVLQDLAAWVMTEIELRLLAKQFQAGYMELRNTELQRDELTHMLVHDLRNPLTSLLIGLDLIQGAPGLDEATQQCVSLASKNGKSLLQMVSDILDVSKAEAGRMKLDLADVSPKRVIETACEQTAQLAQKPNVKVTINIAELPLIKADAEKLRRVLVNLISNAIQHTPPHGHVEVSARQSADKKSVIFEVADSGYGISKDAFSQIFEKFGQVKTRQVGKVSTGLGLPFCKLAVEAHGGHISVESELGEGTIFRFEIPNMPPVLN